ncbi:response regulator [Mucilaginibacter sp. BT774]|uniref:response regulator n=1 Tax=Mucilaginibacter sp. BT774 TaxID=3062276 RepID=UPI002675C070|nr:response regulator [Mucilaginibacter sp. BT774]MDO3628635.1 response regulator [Mucilaginibacter sp. BT774]
MNKLVLIDDEPVFHKIVQMTIKNTELSKKATYCFDGEVILDYLEEKKQESQSLPDYIFVDLYMPMFDGWDFLNRFQELYKSLQKNIKIYVVTSSVNPADINRSKLYPFVTTFISKPIMKDVFDDITYA